MPYIIVGADPGHTIGLCAIDLAGKHLCSSSIENGGIAKAVSLIESWGTPSIIACDVFPAPEFSQKLASYFNTRLYTPSRNLREEFKRDILRREEARAQKKLAHNNHERDALSAAIMAWRHNQNLIRSAFSSNEPEKIIHLMLQGYSKDSALLELNLHQKTKEFELREVPIQSQDQKSPVPTSHMKDSLIQRQNISLARRVESLENENARLRTQIKSHESGSAARIMRDGEIRRLRSKISRLESRLKEAHSKKTISRPKSEHVSEKNNYLQKNTMQENASVSPPAKKESKISAHDLKGLNSFDKLARLVHEYRRTRSSQD